jgi:type II secretory pathway component PulC
MIGLQLSPHRALAASALLLAGLSGVLIVELSSSEVIVPPEESIAGNPPHAAPAASSDRFSLPPLSSFAEVTERPLFSVSRRPAAAEVSQAGDQKLSVTLAGIVTSPISSSVIVAHGEPPVLTRLKEGDNIDGWLVRLIEANRVVLRRGDIDQQLKLHDIPGQANDDTTQTTRSRRR